MSAPEPSWITQAVVTNVVDGDTVDIEIRRTIRIRMLDCWAPESRTRDLEEKERGLAAKEHLTCLVAGKRVVVVIPTEPDGDLKDILTMNRTLGRIFLDEHDVSGLMVEAGHATKHKEA